MPNVTAVHQYGNQLALAYDDGNTLLAYQSSSALWTPVKQQYTTTPPPPTVPGNDEFKIVSPLPTSLAVQECDGGAAYTLNATQIERAAQIISAALQIPGVNQRVLRITLMTSVTETHLRNYSNVTNYPETGSLPDIDADASDTDSVGLFQQRPSAGWGTPTECATPAHATAAFIGGQDGPNHGSPRGLFDIPGWTALTDQIACQRVQVSAFADGSNYYPNGCVADQILAALLVETPGAGSPGGVTYPPGAPGPWGGYSNGAIPTSALKQIPWTSGAPNYQAPWLGACYLRTDACNQLINMNTAFRKSFTYNIPINDGYRDLRGQQWAYDTYGYPAAAIPGTSNHGWALAVDIGTTTHARMGEGTTQYNWFAAHAITYGFKRIASESWHWEFWGL